jgi:hypothetical protein
MKMFVLPFCTRTQRWQVVRRNNGNWGFPIISSILKTNSVGIIKPYDYGCGLFKANAEIANQYYKGWAWYSLGALKDKPFDVVLDLLYPQLINLAHSGSLLDTPGVSYTLPETNPPLLFASKPIFGRMRHYGIWYKGNCISSAVVDPRSGMLYDVKVIMPWRRRGIAKQLMEFVLSSDTPPTKLTARPSLVGRGLELGKLIDFYTRYGFKLIDPTTNLMSRE